MAAGKPWSIGVAAYSGEPSGVLVDNAAGFVEELAGLAPAGSRIVLGGYWGLMRVVADEAAARGFLVIYILPSSPPARPPRGSRHVVIETPLDPVARSVVLVRSSDAVVVLGGMIGSMMEALMAYDYSRPVVVVESGMDTDKLLRLGEYLDSRRKTRVVWARDGREAARLVAGILGDGME